MILTKITNLEFLYKYEWKPAKSEALKCVSCNSSAHPECAQDPSKIDKIEECGSLQNSCITAILLNNHTYRGCKPANLEFESPNEECLTDTCNNKIYPSDRLKCLQCTGEKCVLPDESIKPIACSRYMKNDLCYTSIKNTTYGSRGCLSDFPDIPLEEIEFCETGSGCNNQNGIIETKCGHCYSIDNSDCVRSLNNHENITNTGECKTSLLRGQNIPACFTYHRLDRVIRDCYINKDKHKNLIDKFISTCFEDYCNKKSIPPQKCVICGKDTTTDINCILNKIEDCKGQESSCYTCSNIDNRNDIKRGCGSNPNTRNCYQCQENGCNIKTSKYCYKCSSHNDPNCAELKNRTILTKELCETPDTTCMIGIDTNGFTIRQCTPANFDKIYYKNSEKCSGQLCNDYVFPISQQKCFVCNGTDECNAKPKLEMLRPCSVIRETNKCYEFKRNGTDSIVRGCSTDSNYKECTEQGDNCKTCLSSSCNNLMITLKKSKLSCNKCHSNINENCKWTQNDDDDTNSINCNSFIPIEKEEFCYSIVYENNTNARGCSWDDQICTNVTENNLCKICNKDNCNKEVLIPQQCIQKENVTDDVKDLKKEPCTSKEQYSDNQGCYVYRNGNQITWGCISEIPSDLLGYCNFKDSKCNLCKGSDCNEMKVPNKSNIIVMISNYLLLTVIAFTLKM